MGGKKEKIKTVIVGRLFTYAHNGIVFRFVPGEKWKIAGDYPGDPASKTMAKSLYMELKPLSIFK